MLNLDTHFFPVFDRLDPATAFPHTYILGLVATSVAIAILAAFVALSISGRIVAATTRWARHAWASAAGAISMGGGIWSMHFVGMLAFSLPCGITYDPVGTVLSIIPGMLASGIALSAISKPDEPGLSRLSVSAVLMGVGIAAMHYSGMAAMLASQTGKASQRDRPRAKGKASGKRRIRTLRKLPMTGEATRSSTHRAGFGDPTNNSATLAFRVRPDDIAIMALYLANDEPRM